MQPVEYSLRTYEGSAGTERCRMLLCTLSARYSVHEFTDAREGALLHALVAGIAVQTLQVRSSDVARSRNVCVEQLLTRKWENGPPPYLVFFDDDMVFPDDILVRLVDTAEREDADVVGVLATGRAPPYPVCVLDGELQPFRPEEAARLHAAGRAEPVSAVGMSCTLIRTAILERVGRPWFTFSRHVHDAIGRLEAARERLVAGERLDTGELEAVISALRHRRIGEDYAFCLRARDVGARVLCDFGVSTMLRGRRLPGVGHVGGHAFSLLDALEWERAQRAGPPTGD